MRLTPLLLLPLLCFVAATAAAKPRDAKPLWRFARETKPWLKAAGNEEQRQPVYFGLTPKELQSGRNPESRLAFPAPLKILAERQAAVLAKTSGRSFEAEIWPALDWDGKITWAFARWRENANDVWRWFDPENWIKDAPKYLTEPTLPDKLDASVPADSEKIFADFLTFNEDYKSLYAQPAFANCVWTDATGKEVLAAWLSPDARVKRRRAFEKRRLTCRALSQPARFNGKPFSLIVRFAHNRAEWPDDVAWVPPAKADLTPIPAPRKIRAWPSSLKSDLIRDVKVLTGEIPAVFVKNGASRIRTFTRKNSADPKNQLLDMVDYLEARYRELGIKTRREKFTWRGIRQANLKAVIPGSGADRRPVILADHFDTAFSEDIFARSRFTSRVATAGADDNAIATAALLAAANFLSDSKPLRDIWLVHLTGEEYPADSLGARVMTGRFLKKRQEISGIVLLDMIAWRRPGDRLFQINAGDSRASLFLARVAAGATRDVAPGWRAAPRPRFDARNYLHNTDGLIFSDAGFPVILLNEHINNLENMNRPHYHQSTDRTGTLDFDLAAAIARTAIETAARLANGDLSP